MNLFFFCCGKPADMKGERSHPTLEDLGLGAAYAITDGGSGAGAPTAAPVHGEVVAVAHAVSDGKTQEFRIKGKNGAKVRSGVAKTTPEVTMLARDAIVLVVVGSEVEHDGEMRVKIVAPVEGYVSAKMLSKRLRASIATADAAPSERMS